VRIVKLNNMDAARDRKGKEGEEMHTSASRTFGQSGRGSKMLLAPHRRPAVHRQEGTGDTHDGPRHQRGPPQPVRHAVRRGVGSVGAAAARQRWKMSNI
jgi:hypothetical protein